MTVEISLNGFLPAARAALKQMASASSSKPSHLLIEWEPIVKLNTFTNFLWKELQPSVPGIEKRPANAGYSEFEYRSEVAGIPLKRATTEVFHYLVNRGILVPVHQPFPDNPRGETFFLSARGSVWIQGVEPDPEDAAAYMATLCGLVKALDPIIADYVTEGLRTFHGEMNFAAAVMLGAASEKAVYLLADDLRKSCKAGTRRKKFDEFLEYRKLFELLKQTEATISDATRAKTIPYSVSEGAHLHLASLFESIRTQRNDAVHPLNSAVSAASVRHSYAAFPHALATVERIRDWCQTNIGVLA